jgi:hypothetical protein
MDQLGSEAPFARFVAAALKQDGFVLIDVGAADGIAPAWRCFGAKLQGFGFDPDAAEVERLNGVESAPGFRYVSGYVGLPADTPFAKQRRGKPRVQRNPWFRLAVDRWLQLQRARRDGQPVPPDLPRPRARGDDPAQDAGEYSPVINLPEFLQEAGVGAIDFIKVDVDGTDFDILQSMAGWYQKAGVLGIGVEINFFGSGAETGNTFHNIDRFLKGEGFELLDFSVRRYAMRDLPGPSAVGLPYPAMTAFGRPYQGDAFYARDVCAPWEWVFADSLPSERLAKSAALFAMFGLPDCAAEILVTFRDRLESLLDVDQGLELLAAQAQPGNADALSYRDYIAAFEKQSYEIGGVYSQRLPQPPRARSEATARPLVPLAYDGARRIVLGEASCSGTTRLSIRTPAGRWHHAVEFPLAAAGLDPETRLCVTLSVVVQRGCVGFGILSADGRSVPQQIFVGKSDGPCLVELFTDRLSLSGSLLVRNGAADGNSSELEMEIVAAARLADSD